MAIAQNLSVLAYANRFTLWHYRTVEKDFPDGYFDNMADMLRENDMLIACTDIAGAPKTGFYIVGPCGKDGVKVHPFAG